MREISLVITTLLSRAPLMFLSKQKLVSHERALVFRAAGPEELEFGDESPCETGALVFRVIIREDSPVLLFHDWNRGGYKLHRDCESEEKFQEMTDLFTPPLNWTAAYSHDFALYSQANILLRRHQHTLAMSSFNQLSYLPQVPLMFQNLPSPRLGNTKTNSESVITGLAGVPVQGISLWRDLASRRRFSLESISANLQNSSKNNINRILKELYSKEAAAVRATAIFEPYESRFIVALIRRLIDTALQIQLRDWFLQQVLANFHKISQVLRSCSIDRRHFIAQCVILDVYQFHECYNQFVVTYDLFILKTRQI
ncbi:hypothetical protein RJ640_005017 [Escallonia rubra]|uniref:Ycf2 N-terminal domain-containing protein n=1 Tax=Escallonia rubra TaxID=112253 RepID=A0AA88QP10_9ASTE|nr:hypothetical protein RJ640_005017 [Escallonia rubra]